MWPRNSYPRSYVISDEQGYLDIHIVSTKISIVINFLSLYCITLNHPFTGSILVTSFIIKEYFSFSHILLGTIKSTQIFSQGVSSTNLVGNLPHFYWPFHYAGMSHIFWLPFRRRVLCWARINDGKSLTLYDPVRYEGDTYVINVLRMFEVSVKSLFLLVR